MFILTWNRCCIVMFLAAILNTGTSQVSETHPKANSIKPAGLEDAPTPATNRSTTVHSRITKKHNILTQVEMEFSLYFLKHSSFTHRLGFGKSVL